MNRWPNCSSRERRLKEPDYMRLPVVKPWRKPDLYVPGREVAKQIGPGMSAKMLNLAARDGLLKPGDGFYRLHRTAKPRFCLPIVKDLASQIRAHYSRNLRRQARIKKLRRLFDSDQACTARKLELAAAIRYALELELELQQRLEAVYRTRRRLEDDYQIMLWERKDCPHCKGTGNIYRDDRAMGCVYCLPVIQTESTATSAVDSVASSSE